jgi:hypothetical protein
MSTIHLARDFLAISRYRLEQVGFQVEIGGDMHRWAAETCVRGGLANPQFRDYHKDQSNSHYALIYRHAPIGPEPADAKAVRECPRYRQLVGSITWRTYTTLDYVADFESGFVWYDKPDRDGFQVQSTGLRGDLMLRGRITSRGGINRFVPDRGLRISWWLTGFAMAHSLLDGSDYNIGVPLQPIAEGGVPDRLYGYRHQCQCSPLVLSFVGPDKLTPYIAWSSASEVAEEVSRRLAALQNASDEDLGAIFDAFEREHQPQKRPVDKSASVPGVAATQ